MKNVTLSESAIVRKLRQILCIELVAYYFAAPYIILLGLDDKRGLFDADCSLNYRLFAYALLVGIYPFLQIIVSPYIGRQLDQKLSKASILRKIHFANGLCYLLLALASVQHSLLLALIGLCIPGFVGCASPIGKSLISSLTDPAVRVEEFAKLAFMRGVVKLTAPLLGVVVFQLIFDQSAYWPLFIVSSMFSFSCFAISFSFPERFLHCPIATAVKKGASFALFSSIVRKNYRSLFVFIFLLTGYSVFVKFTPIMLLERLPDQPSLINYFTSLVGFTFSLNQFIVVRFAKHIERLMSVIFCLLCSLTVLLCLSSSAYLFFGALFGILFCFSVLATCIEARVSLEGVSGNQGAVQGILYSVENWSLLLAPIIGSSLASISTVYPLYFVTVSAVLATLFFAGMQFAKLTKLSEIKP